MFESCVSSLSHVVLPITPKHQRAIHARGRNPQPHRDSEPRDRHATASTSEHRPRTRGTPRRRDRRKHQRVRLDSRRRLRATAAGASEHASYSDARTTSPRRTRPSTFRHASRRRQPRPRVDRRHHSTRHRQRRGGGERGNQISVTHTTERNNSERNNHSNTSRCRRPPHSTPTRPRASSTWIDATRASTQLDGRARPRHRVLAASAADSDRGRRERSDHDTRASAQQSQHALTRSSTTDGTEPTQGVATNHIAIAHLNDRSRWEIVSRFDLQFVSRCPRSANRCCDLETSNT